MVSYTYSNEQTDAKGYGLYLVDVFGNKELVYRDPAISSFIPMPLRARPARRCSRFVDLIEANATCVVSDVGFGSEEIAPGASAMSASPSRLAGPMTISTAASGTARKART